MKLFNLKINDEFQLHGRRYVVTHINAPKVYVIAAGNAAVEEEYDFLSLITNPTFEPSALIQKRVSQKSEESKTRHFSNLDALSEKNRQEVSQRFEVIDPLLLLDKAKNGDLKAHYQLAERYREYLTGVQNIEKVTQKFVLQQIASKTGISTRTLKRYLADYRREENERPTSGIEGLIRKNVFKGDRIRSDEKPLLICHPKKKDLVLDTIYIRKDERYLPILKEVIEMDYLSTKRPKISMIARKIETKCTQAKLDPIDYDTVAKLIGRIDKQIRERMRDGRAAAQKYNPVQRGWSNQEALFPLHIVEIDHTQLDIDVISKTGDVTGRPWITLGIDVYTRMVWCMHISFEHPSANKVRKAIEHGIFLKRSREKYNTLNDWDIHGIPSIIYMDNGPEFKNAEVKRMINDTLHSEVRYRPVKTPNYGGTIERLIGTLNWGIIHSLDGTRKSSVEDLGDYNPEENAIYTLDDVIELLTLYITDIYHHKVHRGLPLDTPTPASMYFDGLSSTGVPEWINEEDEPYYKIELLPTIEKPYTRDGVRLENVEYKSPELFHMIQGRYVKYKVKYDIDDISRIYILLPKTNEYVEVFAANPPANELYGVSRYMYKKMLENLRTLGKLNMNRIPGSRQLAEAKSNLHAKVEAKKQLNRREIQEAQRMGYEYKLSPPTKVPNKNKPEVDLFDLYDLQKSTR
ncbi:Mu transposase C-terminal domain-containing protein [Brevibacillus sp. NPDC003359]|uniref:Mu transposase C-terminal domain-containing protein n=1 Tax=unclassified Brevibacillus TaxID=2684853 RepID=UPI0036AFE786